MLVLNKIVILSLVLLVVNQTQAEFTNQLANHPSPYLAMHGNDPVAWQSWGEDVMSRARKNDQLVYVSIGYFSCHWCHVMQRESYSNPAIAQLLNKHFVPVKVDRELEPALDARLIDFTESTQGRAGWPLNVFLTPQGDPLYAVLYMPPDQFKTVVSRLNDLWSTDREQLLRLAQRGVTEASGPGGPKLEPQMISGYIKSILAALETIGDTISGGFGQQNKFPSVPQLRFLLHQYQRHADEDLKSFLLLTLDQMATKGLRDHLGGGFYRYTVDPDWETPHFEKMLYGNSQLAELYLEAWQVFGRDTDLAVARQTLDFMRREMRSSDGAMVASFSAVDDQGREGAYYLWSDDQLKKLLGPNEIKAIHAYYALSGVAPFEDGHLPMQGVSIRQIAQQLNLSVKQVDALTQSAINKLTHARQQRSLPVDTKLLAGWNGLALRAFATAARLLASPDYQQTAQGIRDYLHNQLWMDNGLIRALSNGKAYGQATIQDYAYVADGLRAWAELTNTSDDFQFAVTVAEQGWQRFYRGGVWRQAERSLMSPEPGKDHLLDGPMPSPTAVLINASLALNLKQHQRSIRALNAGASEIANNPFWHASHVDAMVSQLSITDRQPR